MLTHACALLVFPFKEASELGLGGWGGEESRARVCVNQPSQGRSRKQPRAVGCEAKKREKAFSARAVHAVGIFI